MNMNECNNTELIAGQTLIQIDRREWLRPNWKKESEVQEEEKTSERNRP